MPAMVAVGVCAGNNQSVWQVRNEYAYADAAEQMRVAYQYVLGGLWREVVHSAQAPYALRGDRITSG